jgi:hypothetical protein
MSNSFGKFPSFSKFIESFEITKLAEKKELEQKFKNANLMISTGISTIAC